MIGELNELFFVVVDIPQVIGELNELLDWFGEAEDKLRNPSPVTANPEALQKQLAEQKVLKWVNVCFHCPSPHSCHLSRLG